MALTVTIATVDRTSIVETDSIKISQVADSFTFTAELSLFDEDGDITILAGSHNDAGAEAVRSDITIVDGATTYFGGYVVNQDIEAAEDGSRHLKLQCQGYGIRLNETLVEYEEYTTDSDKEIIDDLFDTYLATFDSDAEVAAIVDPLAISFTEMTLAECMEAICQRTQGRWYIDNEKNVHYFAAEENEVAWFLSDTPEVATTNYIVDPIFGHVPLTDYWTNQGLATFERKTTQQKFGPVSLRGISDAAADYFESADLPAADATETWTASCWVYIVAGDFRLRIWEFNGGWAQLDQVAADATKTNQWQKVSVTATLSAGVTRARLIFSPVATAVSQWHIDGVQFEEKAAVTTLCHGGRAGCAWQGDAHASVSTRIISYSYHAKPTKQIDAAAIVNRIRVVGADDFAVTRNDATSQAAYGIRAGIITDQTLETTAAMEERGDEVLDKNKDPRTTYVVDTFQDGSVAGMDIGFRCPPLDVDTTQVIRELNIRWEQKRPVYRLTLGTHADVSAISRAFYTSSTIRKVIVSPNIPMGSRGWGHDIPFVATDYRTVKWVDGGTITLAGGVGSFAIAANAGNSTGNMAATTYIYFDADVSLTALQDDVDPANAIGMNKILIAVAGPVADEDTNLAIFQVFGGAGAGVLIVADNIAADTITANEVAANAIEAGHINVATLSVIKADMGVLTAGEIRMYADTWDVDAVGFRITADEIASQNAGADQVRIDAADGKLYAGAGAVILDESGVDIAVTDAEGAVRAYKFSLSGVNVGGLYGLATAAGGWLRLYAIERVDKTSYIDIQALAPATYVAQTFIRAKSGATDVILSIKADSDAGTPGYGLMTGATYMDFNCKVYGDSFSTDNGVVRWEFGAAVGALPIAFLGYMDMKINGVIYHVPHCSVP